jgi:hypothetical protein
VSDTIPTHASSSAIGRWAEVRAAEHVTRYFRRGAGAPVVVLGAFDGSEHLWPDLVESLPMRHRVYFPESSAAGSDFTNWLLTFLDGLGVPPVVLLAAGPHCAGALELGRLAPEQLGRLVVVPASQVEADRMTAALTASGEATLPVLILARECPAGEALARVERFVTGENA